ncbi:universal stress protein [Motiliproteus sp. MSK22-1]|uniref:universal stress protein n=1 Tax=Motiliproteus sp. MSK22-1 TaxID=1897630 RepID=UPI0009769698|nr:universal stress protein [Motiliproteus sp. MSK22-1]OMH30332.1 universal stress protein [Motiliproteus sp. MSK22-1]
MSLPEVKTILYTTSLSKHTRPVFRQAIKLASLYQAKIVMLHVVEPIGEMGHALIENYLPEDLVKKMHDEGIENIKTTMKERVVKFYEDELSALNTGLTLDIEQVVAEGNHTDSIVGAAKQFGADLIVMGSHNTLGRSSNTTRQVIKYAKLPVLVVPTEG